MSGIKCERCGGATRVTRTRPAANYITRRRECATCGWRGTTVERSVNIAAPTAPAICDHLARVSIHTIVENALRLAQLTGTSPAASLISQTKEPKK